MITSGFPTQVETTLMYQVTYSYSAWHSENWVLAAAFLCWGQIRDPGSLVRPGTGQGLKYLSHTYHSKAVVVDLSDRGIEDWDGSAQSPLSLGLMGEILNTARAHNIKGFIKATVPV